ncbi:cell adhesion molecule Dscam1-like [Dermacentor albipictus]|uniref:cell adhesion molecule Dscam1-like n=1 Tax=Dermacentor albipictus TaxID=60249 RepID=UPI0031FD4DD6
MGEYAQCLDANRVFKRSVHHHRLSSFQAWRLLPVFFMAWVSTVLAFSPGARGEPLPPTSNGAAPPAFLREPPVQTVFSNSTGALVSCSASGQPRPSVTWTNETGSPLEPLPGLRRVRPDGTLEFFPFRGEEYRQDAHSTRYRCRASNALGTVVSRSVHVKAMVQQTYTIRVYDDFVIRMNTGVLRCHVPKYVREYVIVTSWIRSDGFIISVQAIPDENSKYVAFRTGELHVRRAGPEDSHHSFQCQTKDTLTGAAVSSITAGKLVITEPHSSIPAKVIHWSRQVEGPHGSTLFVPCEAQGHPEPSYRWYRQHGSRLRPLLPLGEPGIVFVGGTLVFRRASVQDSATYVCVVSNGAGVEDKNEMQVLVTEPLEVDVWTRTREVRSGDSLTLNCSVSGFPIRSVTWFKDGRPITGPSAAKGAGRGGGQVSSRRVLMLNQYVLRIQAAQSDDSGVYQCHAANERDSAQAQAYVHVRSEPPVLVSHFEDVVVRPEEPVSLRCAATGTPLPQITWSIYDVQVQDSSRVRVGDYVSRDGSVISFVNVTRARHEDGGAYRCEASNEHGSQAHAGRLNVLGPPAVHDMPNRTVVAGRRAVLHCPYYGHPVTRVAWRKDAKSLPSSKRVMTYPNGSLVLEAVSRKDDEGRYSCSVSSEHGSETHNYLYLRVLVPPSITPFSFPEKPQLGSRASVTCSVPEGDPPIRLSWLRDGVPLDSASSATSAVGISSGHVDDFISTLVFRSLREEHTAVYTCLAANEAAFINYSAPLVVYAPPRWRLEPKDTTVTTGDRIILDCQADGTPEPRVRWKKSAGLQGTEFRTVISSSRMQSLVNGSLVIQEVETLDAGGYMCEATNGVGLPLYTVVQVNVHSPAKVRQHFMSQTTARGQVVKLRCEATGDKPIRFFWSKDSKPIKSFSSPRYSIEDHSGEDTPWSELVILFAEKNDTGTFRCDVSNSYGQDEQVTHLSIQDRPEQPPRPEVLNVLSRSVTILWKSPGDGNSPITKYIVQYKRSAESWEKQLSEMVAESDQSQVTVQDLQPLAEYNFRVLAQNAIGVGPPSEALTVVTDGEVPATPPQSVKVTAVSSRKIEVSWKPPPAHLQYGEIQGYYVGYRVHGSTEPYVFKTVTVPSTSSHVAAGGAVSRCVVDDLQRATAYAVVVQAYNDKGAGPLSDEIRVHTHEHDPPPPPSVIVTTRTTESIELAWTPQDEEIEVVDGYVARCRLHDSVEWKEVSLGPDKRSYLFEGLECGSAYTFSVLCFNHHGRSEPEELLHAMTEGTVPQAPSAKAAVVTNRTYLGLVLAAWNDGGCPISHFFVQYRPRDEADWTLLSSRVLPDRDVALIVDLVPGTWYQLLVVAYNSAGSTRTEYTVATLTTAGDPLEPDKISEVGRKSSAHRYRSLSIIIPVCCSLVVLTAVTVAIIVLICRRRSPPSPPSAIGAYEDVRFGEGGKMDSITMSELEKSHATFESGGADTEGRKYYYSSPCMSSKLADISRGQNGGDSADDACLHAMAKAAVTASPYSSARTVVQAYDAPQHQRGGCKPRRSNGILKHALRKNKQQNSIELCREDQYNQRYAAKCRTSYGYSPRAEYARHSAVSAYHLSESTDANLLDREV